MTQGTNRLKTVRAESRRQKRWAAIALILAPLGWSLMLYVIDQGVAAVCVAMVVLLIWAPFILYLTTMEAWRFEDGCLLLRRWPSSTLRMPVSEIAGIERRALVARPPQNLYAQFDLVMRDGSRFMLGKQAGGTGTNHVAMGLGAAAVARSVEELAARLELMVWEDPAIDPFYSAFARD